MIKLGAYYISVRGMLIQVIGVDSDVVSYKFLESGREYRSGKKSFLETYKLVSRENMVDKPKHYIGDKGLEVEEVLRNFLPRYTSPYEAHRVASAIEYILRSPFKNGTEDLEKAIYNLQQFLKYRDNNDK